MRYGEVVTVRDFKVRGFKGNGGATIKTTPGAVMALMYLGTITPDNAPYFSADGVLASVGYGPIMASVTQRAVVDALKVARGFMQEMNPGRQDALQTTNEALARAENFYKHTEHLTPILKDAARFNALLTKLESKPGAADALEKLLAGVDAYSPDVDTRGELLAVIDAATAK